MTISSAGRLTRSPSASFPDLIEMQSSSTSIYTLLMRTRFEESISMPSELGMLCSAVMRRFSATTSSLYKKKQAPDSLIVEVEAGHVYVFGILDTDQPGPPAPGHWWRRRSRRRPIRRHVRVPSPATAAQGIVLQPLFTGSVDGALSRDLEVRQAFGIDERGGPRLFRAFPSGVDHRVIVDVGGPLENAVLFDVEICSLLQEDGAAEEGSFRNNHDAATGSRAWIDGCLNGFGIH